MTAPRLRLVDVRQIDVRQVDDWGTGPATDTADLQPPPPFQEPSQAPASFTRIVSTPAAWPWRQRQAAELEARHGSPLPPDEIAYQLSRLAPWRAGQLAQFVVTYTHAVGGRTGGRGLARSGVGDVLAALLPSGDGGLDVRSRGRLLLLLAWIAALLLFAFAAITAWERRTATTAELAELQRRTIVADRRAVNAAAAQRETRMMLTLGVQVRSPQQVLADMAWISRHAAPSTVIQAFHWRAAVSAVEVAGSAAPFTAVDRGVRRAAQPLRPGVWLWGVEPARPLPAILQAVR